MKKVGIITMHKVLNCGSALQAYALQYVIEKMGYCAELIDYIYPNEYHRNQKREPGLKGFLRRLYSYFLTRGNKKHFDNFYKKFFKLSSKCYLTKEELETNPPKYDIYVSGSDQVWNPKSIFADTSFMLSFVNNGAKKIAYAGSFASDINNEYRELYSKALSSYDHLSVREEKSSRILAELSGKKGNFVLDPALLLDKTEWADIVFESDVKIEGEYVLVYILGYSFNIYPYVYELIKYVQNKYNKQVVVLSMSNRYVHKLKNKTIISTLSPQNFLSLIANASLVITDSFHATAMSMNFETPVYSVIKNKSNSDNRVYSLLSSLKAENRAIEHGTDFNSLPPFGMDFIDVTNLLDKLRKESMLYLENSLK